MIRYSNNLEGIEPRMLAGGFWVGWLSQPSPETHLRILDGSTHRWLAIDDDRQMVVGFITAISDGVQAAYIPLLEVLPEYQGQGVSAASWCGACWTTCAISIRSICCATPTSSHSTSDSECIVPPA